MVMEMYDTVKHLPQKITFPVLAVMAKNGWPHLSWLLSQSSRYFTQIPWAAEQKLHQTNKSGSSYLIRAKPEIQEVQTTQCF